MEGDGEKKKKEEEKEGSSRFIDRKRENGGDIGNSIGVCEVCECKEKKSSIDCSAND